jgi:hypothetical protein
LGVDHRDIRVERGHRGQRLAGERAGDRGDVGGVRRQVGAGVTAQDRERQSGGAGGVPVGHAGMAVLLQPQGRRPAVRGRVAEPVQRTDARVAAPGEDQPAGAAGADHLVVDDVRRHPDQGEVATALADDLVPGRDRDQVGEPLHRHGVAVVDERGDRFAEGHQVGQCCSG